MTVGRATVREVGAIRVETTSPIGERPPHACLPYRSDAERAELARQWLHRGIADGMRGIYVGDAAPESLRLQLIDDEVVAGAIDDGALDVYETHDYYAMPAPIDPASRLADYDAAMRRALAEGFTGLRVVADITPLVIDPSRHIAHLRWEQAADRFMTDHPFSPLCTYDARAVPPLDAVVAVHCVRPVDATPFELVGVTPTSAALRGEVDHACAEAFGSAVTTMPDTDTVLDVEALEFIDARSTRELHSHVERRRSIGRPLVLANPPRPLQRVWDLCGFDRSAFA